jgi:hypothetical protein
VTVARIGGGFSGVRYQVMDVESQRRIIVARLFGVGIAAVRVETALLGQRETRAS